MNLYKNVLILIVGILVLIVVFLFAAVFRRIRNARKYAELDRCRDRFRRVVDDALRTGSTDRTIEELRARPKSLPWRAAEDVLFERLIDPGTHDDVRRILSGLGYGDYYERKLLSRRPIEKAAAADKLGKMLRGTSSPGLLRLVRTEEAPEVLTVTVRAVCRCGDRDGLQAILERLPELYRRTLVSQKTIEASLISFGADVVPLLVAYANRSEDGGIRASLLEVLSHLPATPLSLSFAAANTNAPDPEVRAKAIRVIGRLGASGDGVRPGLLLPLLADPVWFVRLQAAKALELLRYEPAVGQLGALLLDPNWQVRNAAARALASMGDAALDVFLSILRERDHYAKQSICEEAQRTDLTQRLIANLGYGGPEVRAKSREILGIMLSLNFSTRLRDYLDHGDEEGIKREIALLMHETEAPRNRTSRPVARGAANGQG